MILMLNAGDIRSSRFRSHMLVPDCARHWTEQPMHQTALVSVYVYVRTFALAVLFYLTMIWMPF